jgi:hypothetical protein
VRGWLAGLDRLGNELGQVDVLGLKRQLAGVDAGEK